MGKIYQMTTNYTKRQNIIPNGRKILQNVIKYNNIYIPRPSKMYPNLDFWLENKPSGNPAALRPVYTDSVFCVARQSATGDKQGSNLVAQHGAAQKNYVSVNRPFSWCVFTVRACSVKACLNCVFDRKCFVLPSDEEVRNQIYNLRAGFEAVAFGSSELFLHQSFEHC
jgi:hypothetical protein